MISTVGTVATLLGLGGAVALAWYAGNAARSGPTATVAIRWSVVCLVVGAVTAFGALEWAILSNDFSVQFVADHSARNTPIVFKVATAWSALEGSIVLWVLVLSGYVAVVARQVRHRSVDGADRLGAGALAVMALVAVFFFGLVATVASPFRSIGPVPLDGPGPNPLLQNHILMAVHPPLLYLGYIGFTVPFAFAVSALALGEQGPQWVRRTQRWALIAWTFLTAGIIGGAWWSYEVLGWGGYWAWDPVENASLLPWLVGTAYLHSATMQARRGVLKAWSIALVLATFSLTILGTFLTRSGVIASVHSFTQSPVGPALLGFFALVVIGSFGLFAARAHLVASPTKLDSLASREGAFLLNNLLLTVFALVVLTGTVYPLLVEAFSGDQLSVGRPFFDQMAVPLAGALLLAMGIGTVLPYRVARRSVVWDRLRIPVVVALAIGAVTVLWFSTPASVTIVVTLASLIVASGLTQLLRSAHRIGGRPLSAIGRVVVGDPGYWGGQLAHAGIAVLAVGVACSSALAQQRTVTIDTGSSEPFAGYTVTYDGMYRSTEPNRTVRGAEIVLSKDGEALTTLRPNLAEFQNQVQAVGTPAVWTGSWGDDVYASITNVDDQSVRVTLYRFPLVSLVWIGGYLTALGGVVGLVLRAIRRGRGSAPRRPADASTLPDPDLAASTARPSARRSMPPAVWPVVIVALSALMIAGQLHARPAEGDRAQHLAARLRCPVCEGEAVSDSPARTAQDMRDQIQQQTAEGRTDAEILAYFQQRYGDWILLDPPVDRRTWPLWVVPGLALVVGGVVIVRRRDAGAPPRPGAPTPKREEVR